MFGEVRGRWPWLAALLVGVALATGSAAEADSAVPGLIPGPMVRVGPADRATLQIDYRRPPGDPAHPGQVMPVLVSMVVSPGDPITMSAVRFSISDPQGGQTMSAPAAAGATLDTQGRPNSNVQNALLTPPLLFGQPLLGIYTVTAFNYSAQPVTFIFNSTGLPLTLLPPTPTPIPTPTWTPEPTVGPMPTASPTPQGTPLSRDQRWASGRLPNQATVVYTVQYDPGTEGTGTLAPWLLSLRSIPAPTNPHAVGFTLLDQTAPVAGAGTRGALLTSQPAAAGSSIDVRGPADVSGVQNAVLAGQGRGTFVATVFNFSGGPVDYTLTLYPLLGGQLEPNLPPPPTPTPAPFPPSPPAWSTPSAAFVPSVPSALSTPFTPFWVKTLVRGAQLWSNPASPPGVSFGPLPQFSCLLVAEPLRGARYHVWNPLTRNHAYVDAAQVGGLSPGDRSCGP